MHSDFTVRANIRFALSLCVLAVGGSLGVAAESDLRLVTCGVVRQGTLDGGGSEYALLDEERIVSYRLVPSRRIQLDRYEGQTVRIQGQLKSTGQSDTRTILVEQIATVDKVVPTHFIQVAQEQPRRASEDRKPARIDPAPEPTFTEPTIPPEPTAGPPPMVSGESWIVEDDAWMMNGDPIAASPSDWFASQHLNQTVAAGWPEVVWADLDYLLWWTQGMGTPPLVTTSPAGTPAASAGVLGTSGTSILLGNGKLLTGDRNGVRLRLGTWLGYQRRLGLVVEYAQLADLGSRYGFQSNGTKILARPYTNVGPTAPGGSQPTARLVSYPGRAAGSVLVDASTKMDSWALGMRWNRRAVSTGRYHTCDVCANPHRGRRLDLIGGYRYLQLDDQLSITDSLATGIQTQSGLTSFDGFQTGNEFHALELGVLGEWYRDRWSLEGLFKVDLGRTRQSVWIDGSTQISDGGATTSANGGLLALPTNQGQHSRWTNAAAIELGLTAGYAITSDLQITAGYNVIYWWNTVRAGDQISLSVNETYLPEFGGAPSGAAQPAFAFQQTNFWAHGLNVGLDYRW
jgi:hypothetical protein